jgi:hypothetical protein
MTLRGALFGFSLLLIAVTARGGTFTVELNGTPAEVVAYEDLEVVHFPFSGPTKVRIQRLDGQAIAASRIRPERFGYHGQVQGAELTFALDQPRQLIVNVDKLRKLLLVAEPPHPGKPSGPKVVNVVAAGADPTGKADSTTALQEAIDGLAPGGVLYLPAGHYRSGSLELKSEMTLYLDFGALLQGSPDPEKHRFQKSFLYFLRGSDLHDVRIAGPGIIDANGDAVRTAWQTKLNQTKVPGRALLLQRIRNLELRDVTVRDSYSWNVHIVESDHVRIHNVKVLSNVTHSNGDGFDIDGCVDMEMRNCFVYAEDDAISPKASWSHRTPEKYRIRDCILWSQNATGIRLGDETDAPEFRDMTFENIDILRANSMLRIYNYDGGDLHGIVFRNLWLEEYSLDVQDLGYEETKRTQPAHEGVTSLLHIYVRKRTEKSRLGVVHDILLEGIHSQKLAKTRLTGTARDDGRKSIHDIRFKDCWEGERPLPTMEDLRVKVGADVAEVSVLVP